MIHLQGVRLAKKGRYGPIVIWGGGMFLHANGRNACKSAITVQTLLKIKAQGLVIGRTSKSTHLPGDFVAGKNRCSPICVLRGIFCPQRTEMPVKCMTKVQKLSGNK
jgi:hypothetical protein